MPMFSKVIIFLVWSLFLIFMCLPPIPNRPKTSRTQYILWGVLEALLFLVVFLLIPTVART